MTKQRLPSPAAGHLHMQTMRWDPAVYARVAAYADAQNMTVSYAVHLLVTIALDHDERGCHVVEGSLG